MAFVECAHIGVKTFKFERAALALDFKVQPFLGHAVYIREKRKKTLY